MYHVYTFGRESRQFLILTPKQAAIMNEFTNAFFDAQSEFLNNNGRRWQPDESISLRVRPGFLDEYNELADFCNKQHKIRNWIFDRLRINVMDEEMGDMLVRRI